MELNITCLLHEAGDCSIELPEGDSDYEQHLHTSDVIQFTPSVQFQITDEQPESMDASYALLQLQSDQSVAETVSHPSAVMAGQGIEGLPLDVLSVGGFPLGIGVIAGTFGMFLTYLGARLRSFDTQLSRLSANAHRKAWAEVAERTQSGKKCLGEACSGEDPLTGLLSRFQLVAMGDRLLSGARAMGSQETAGSGASFSDIPADAGLALLCININQFSAINTELGYEAGDELLRKLGSRLRSVIRARCSSSAVLARMGSDEFSLLMVDASHAVVARVSQVVLQALREPVMLQGQSVEVSVRAGAAIAKVHELASFSELISQANLAMANLAMAKNAANTAVTTAGAVALRKRRKTQLVFFDPTMKQQERSRVAFERSLSKAIARQQFRVHYQPIVDLSSAGDAGSQTSARMREQGAAAVISPLPFKTVGFEALIRWQHPEQGLLQPIQFLPLAEKLGLMIQIDRWVLETVCQQLAAWRQPDLVVNVNLSADHLMQPDLVNYIQRLLRYYAISPHQLNLEITEGQLIDDFDRAIAILHQIRALGISVSLDDFGTGYCSLNYLDRLPADVLKIDQSFIRRMSVIEPDKTMTKAEISSAQSLTQLPNSQSPQIIVQAILELAAELNIRVVAEGIEQLEQLELLKEMRCGYGQGYLFSRPTNAQVAGTLL
ncbi:MAG: putative bifunctional diguanylate cyclase/phosphodiesterase [Phormidesmis sp.]